MVKHSSGQGCQIFLGTAYQNGKSTKGFLNILKKQYTKCPLFTYIYQMDIIYAKDFKNK
jgi:hypothetical protein